ncbi:MAG TPA: 2-C-methyl-D-erythritol 4-phosphate cytidylyltransferase, partial [Caldithrix sp.]|nr:2-C-methyl-D-erythritol 4-phosphate cytidylyltransferase [Caldithrix sp.]
PQIFRRSLLESAFQEARNSGFTATDDAGLIEKLGHPVHVVEGDYYNIKITTPEDLAVARRLFLLYFSESGNWIAD